MRWTALPTRREITLILFSITVYLFSYNLETSLDFVGIDTVATQGAVFRHLGLGRTKVIGNDGRKPFGWRDRLESDIFGWWRWDEGQRAGDGVERSQPRASGRHGAQWVERSLVSELQDERNLTEERALERWGDDIPLTTVVKHVPGYTILDNVIVFDGTVYLVTNDKSSVPSVKNIVGRRPNIVTNWEILSKQEAARKIGGYGGIVRGVSWMAAETTFHNSTLIDLWRLYSTLDPNIDAEGHTTLPPPQRLIFPHLNFFTDPNPPFEKHEIRRRRVDTGFDPYLAKAAFPHLTVQYLEDWDDYHKMSVPFVFERLVVVDRQGAAGSVTKGQPANSPPYDLEASQHWWEPVRRTLALYFDRLHEEGGAGKESSGIWTLGSKSKKVIAYLDNQIEDGRSGKAVLVPEDRERLLRALRKMARDNGYEFHLVSTSLDETSWSDRMDVIVRSTILLGVHGDHLLDSVWMRPSPKATLMEFFSDDDFMLDRELVARSLGINYMAWRGGSHFSRETLPEPTRESNNPVHVDADAVVKEILTILSRKEAD